MPIHPIEVRAMENTNQARGLENDLRFEEKSRRYY